MKSNKLKIAGLVALLAVLALLLSGCGGGSNSAPAPTVTVTEEPTQDIHEEIYTAEDEYLYDVRSVGNYYIDNLGDADLLEIGYLICDAFDAGATFDDLAYELVSSGTVNDDETIEYAATLIAGASINLCPEYSYMVS